MQSWATASPRPTDTTPPPAILDTALTNLKRQIEVGGFIMLTKDQAIAVVAKLEAKQ